MHRRWGSETTDALFPLIYYRRGARPGAGEETSFTLFPWSTTGATPTRRCLRPSAAQPTGRTAPRASSAPSLVRGQAIAVRFIPLLHADITNRVTGERTRQYGPWFQTDAPDHWSRAFFPVFGVYQDNRERDTWVFPTFFRMRRKDGDRMDAFLPLYWRSLLGGKDDDRRRPLLRPHRARGSTTTVSSRSSSTPATRSGVDRHPAAALRAAGPGRRQPQLALVPPLLPDARGQRLEHHGVPALLGEEQPDERHRVVFPFYWHFENDELHTNVTLLGPLIKSTTGKAKTWGVLPFAWFTRDGDTGDKSNVFLPVFYQSSGRDQFTLLTALAGYRRKGPSTFWYALPFVLRNRVRSPTPRPR